jgi:MFS family permease
MAHAADTSLAPGPSIVVVVLVTTAAQIASAMGIAIFPVIAPHLAKMLNVDASYVGYLMSILFGAAMLMSAFVGTVVLRWGACRAMQCSLCLCAVAMAAGLSGYLYVMPLVAVLAGASAALAAAGAAHLLFRFGSPQSRNLIFSIKQTGVPLGWATIALVAPVLTVAFSWRVSLLAVLLYSVVGALLLERWRRHWDDDRNPRAAAQTNMLTGVVVLWRYPTLRYLAMAGFFFSFVQLCIGSFTVNMLVQEAGYGLVAAGAMLSLVQVAGMAGRLVFGWLADRSGRAIAVLVVTSLIAGVGCVVSMFISGEWPMPALAVFYVLFGIVVYGWNGVMHAQIARLSPPGMVSVATGGMMVWIFAGILVGPALFAATYRWIGSYTTTFGVLAAVAMASAALAAVAVRAEHRAG